MDAPVRKITGKVLGQDPSPLQQEGSGVVEGIEGAGVLLLPAEVAQCAAPADLLRCPVEDDSRVFLAGHRGTPAHTVVEVPQHCRRPGQLGLEPLQRRHRRLRQGLPPDPLSSKEPPRQQQKRRAAQGHLCQQRLGHLGRGRQQRQQGSPHKGHCSHTAAPSRPGACQQPSEAVGRAAEHRTGLGAEVRRKADAHARCRAGHRPSLVGGEEHQKTQQPPAQGDVHHRQVPQRQQQRRAQYQQAVRVQMLLSGLKQRQVVPGCRSQQNGRRGPVGDMAQGIQGLDHVDPAYCQKQRHAHRRREPPLLFQPDPPQGGGSGEDQHRRSEERQRIREVQKQHRTHAGPRQSCQAAAPRSRRRHASQGERCVAAGRLAGGQRRRQEKADAPGHKPHRLVPLPYHLSMPHRGPSYVCRPDGRSPWYVPTFYSFPPGRFRREMKGAEKSGRLSPKAAVPGA